MCCVLGCTRTSLRRIASTVCVRLQNKYVCDHVCSVCRVLSYLACQAASAVICHRARQRQSFDSKVWGLFDSFRACTRIVHPPPLLCLSAAFCKEAEAGIMSAEHGLCRSFTRPPVSKCCCIRRAACKHISLVLCLPLSAVMMEQEAQPCPLR